MKDLSIYIHIPFCKSKCIYCDFKSFTDVDFKSQEKYFDYLIKEIEYNKELIKKSNILVRRPGRLLWGDLDSLCRVC